MEISPRDLTMLKSYATRLLFITDVDKAQKIGSKLETLTMKIEVDEVESYEVFVEDEWLPVDSFFDGYAVIKYPDGTLEEYSLEDVQVRVIEGDDNSVVYKDKYSHWEG